MAGGPAGAGAELHIVVGLGNPGARFRKNRHNVGFNCLDLLSQRHRIPFAERRRHAVLGTGLIEGCPVVLAKPRTFMNDSGIAVRYLLDRIGTRTAHLRAAGGAGGHRGLDSIMGELDNREFCRLRIGIGRPAGPAGAIGHVLSDFSGEDGPLLDEALDRAAQAVAVYLTDGIEAAMNRFN